jgi:hypothetical protein
LSKASDADRIIAQLVSNGIVVQPTVDNVFVHGEDLIAAKMLITATVNGDTVNDYDMAVYMGNFLNKINVDHYGIVATQGHYMCNSTNISIIERQNQKRKKLEKLRKVSYLKLVPRIKTVEEKPVI